ncbi:MAG TPA: response regulator transcription factor [Elusimicrobiota bacterium]|nr:response regulator transcription factor [Elusimicrobiota bacterium]
MFRSDIRDQGFDGTNNMISSFKSKILIVDDHAVLRQGMRRLIEDEPDLTVCGEAGDGPAALALLSSAKPDAAVVDLGLEGMGGIDLIKNMKMRMPKLLILVVSMYEESVYAERVLRAGARGYVMKKESAEKVVSALRRILSGKVYLSEKMADRMLDRLTEGPDMEAESPVARLSDRELEIFRLIGQGHKTGEIADELSLSVKTIETYREQIKQKLRLEDASELVRYAIEWVRDQGNS